MSLSLEDWKSFLKARLLQESGKDAEALEIFEKLSSSNPSDAHLQASRAYALERLNRSAEAATTRVGAAYSGAANTLVGASDTREGWSARLNSLLTEVENLEKGRAISPTMVVW